MVFLQQNDKKDKKRTLCVDTWVMGHLSQELGLSKGEKFATSFHMHIRIRTICGEVIRTLIKKKEVI